MLHRKHSKSISARMATQCSRHFHYSHANTSTLSLTHTCARTPKCTMTLSLCARWYHPRFASRIQGQVLNEDWCWLWCGPKLTALTVHHCVCVCLCGRSVKWEWKTNVCKTALTCFISHRNSIRSVNKIQIRYCASVNSAYRLYF